MDAATATARPERLDLLYPLSEFLDPVPALPLATHELGGERMPEPYRSLLVHDRDMTSTLEAHHGEGIRLRLLEQRPEGEALFRRVVLVGESSGRSVEFGAIKIDLAPFSAEARRIILAGRRPLGSILADFQVPYTSRPRLFFQLDGSPVTSRIFGLSGHRPLYGRQNVLLSERGSPLAEVVEILPPIGREAAGPEPGGL